MITVSNIFYKKAHFTRPFQMNNAAKVEEVKARTMLQELYRYYLCNYKLLQDEFGELIAAGEPVEKVVCDYIAGMSDGYSVKRFEELFVPKAWTI